MSRPDRPRAPHGPLRLSPRRRLFTWIVGWAVWGSGVAWLVFHYFLPTQGPFGPQANPTEIWWLRGHAATGFLALWSFGMIWSAHIVPGWHARRRCWSGGTAFGVLAALVASGYLIYYVTDDTWHEGIALVHWIVGLGLPLLVVLHVIRGRRVRRSR